MPKNHIKAYFASTYNWRLAGAFLGGLALATLLIDFAPFNSWIEQAAFTQGFSSWLGSGTAGIIQLLGYTVSLDGNEIWFTPQNGIYFDFGCLGYRQMIWFAVFIAIAPGPGKHKTWYIPMGLALIQVSNMLRAAVIGISNYHNPQSFEIIHAQGTLWYIYGTVLLLWLLWLHYFTAQQETATQ